MNIKIKVILIFLLILYLFIGISSAESSSINESDIPGEFNHYIFEKSVPRQMKIGDSYTIRIYIKNTGNTSNNFRVILNTINSTISKKTVGGPSYKEFIYPRYDSSIIRLKKGESRTVEFSITPIKPHIGKLEVTADLYLIQTENNFSQRFELTDSASKEIYTIKSAFSKKEQVLIKILILFILLIFLFLEPVAKLK